MKVELIIITPEAEKVIEQTGRIAYQSQNKITDDSSSKFIKMLVNRQHFSVFEHASASFKISDVSRAFSHQLVRHRLASFTQKSQRYVSEKDFEYVIPVSIKNDGRALEIYLNTMEILNNSYKDLCELGIKNEDARYILPNSCTTEIVITTNFREWRHIVNLRTDKAAQWEIREVCQEILKILKENAPSCFGDIL